MFINEKLAPLQGWSDLVEVIYLSVEVSYLFFSLSGKAFYEKISAVLFSVKKVFKYS